MKITVKANENFFDRANQIQRVKGSEFIVREGHAVTLGKSISAVEAKKDTSPKAATKAEASKSATEYNKTKNASQQAGARKLTEAVKKK